MRTWEDVIKEKMESLEGVLPDNFFVELRARRSGVVPNARSRRGSAAWYIVPAFAIAIAALLLPIRPHKTKPAISNDDLQAGSAVVIRDTSKSVESTARTSLAQSITLPSKQIRYSPTPLARQETLSDSACSTEIIAEKDSSSMENAIIQVEKDTAPDSIEIPHDSPFIPEYLKKRKPIKLSVGAVSGIIAGSGLCLAVATPFLGMIGSGSSADYSPLASDDTQISQQKDGTLQSKSISFPFKGWLSVGIPVADRLRITTGVEYSLYHSRYTYSLSGDKHLFANYLGIPIRLDWIWAENRWIQTYLGGGMKGDLCVGATLDGNSIQGDNIGISLLGAGGIQFNFCKRVGIFFEPEVSWLIPSKNPSLYTYRNAQPIMFSVNTGIRINLGK